MDRICQPFDAKIGTATIGAAFVVTALFLLFPNGTRFYSAMAESGAREWGGFSILLAGAMAFFGSIYPSRAIRHLGQFMSLVSSWWLAGIVITLDVTPALPIVLAVLGTGQFVIWIRDAFVGISHRAELRNGVSYGFQRHR